MIEPGVYKHYKGNLYQVQNIAKHSETEEWMVIYTPLYGEESDRHLWVRPLSMFQEDVEVNGQAQPRFCLIDDSTT